MRQPVWAFVLAIGLLASAAPWRSAWAIDGPTPELGSFAGTAEGALPAGWRVVGFPTGQKPLTRFAVVPRDGRNVLLVEADKSYGNLVRSFERWVPAPSAQGPTLSWSWRMERLPTGADLRQRSGDDTAAKLCVFFDVSLDKVPLVERTRLRLARLLSGEPVPPQALCYVWDASTPALAVGSNLPNAFTGLLRWVVLQSGEARKGQWVAERRNLAEDYRRAFGDELPPIIGVAIGADTDNTQSSSIMYFGDVSFGR